MRVERLHVDADHAWTQKAHRYRGEGWARSPLASIVINATPDTNVKPYILSKDKLIRTLTIRATYRLCGALFMVGDGARKDALDLIENIRCTCLSCLVLALGVTSSLGTSRSHIRSQNHVFARDLFQR